MTLVIIAQVALFLTQVKVELIENETTQVDSSLMKTYLGGTTSLLAPVLKKLIVLALTHGSIM